MQFDSFEGYEDCTQIVLGFSVIHFVYVMPYLKFEINKKNINRKLKICV